MKSYAQAGAEHKQCRAGAHRKPSPCARRGSAEQQFGLLCLRCRDAEHAAQSSEKAGREGQAPALLVVVAVLITS